jgi:hypothetical protein
MSLVFQGSGSGGERATQSIRGGVGIIQSTRRRLLPIEEDFRDARGGGGGGGGGTGRCCGRSTYINVSKQSSCVASTVAHRESAACAWPRSVRVRPPAFTPAVEGWGPVFIVPAQGQGFAARHIRDLLTL